MQFSPMFLSIQATSEPHTLSEKLRINLIYFKVVLSILSIVIYKISLYTTADMDSLYTTAVMKNFST